VSAGTRTSVSTIRVRYAETDQMRVVYHANYLVWFEVARTDLLRSLGWTYREMEADGCSLPVVEAHCKYTRSARYDDELDLYTTARLLSPVRMEFVYDVRQRADQTVVATGYTRHAALGPDGRPMRLPARILDVFA